MDLDLARKRVVEIAGDILAGRLRPLLGARYLSRYAHDLEQEISHDAWRTIVGVDSESDDLPIGPERQYWAPEALQEKDKVACEYPEKVAADVIRVCGRTLASVSIYGLGYRDPSLHSGFKKISLPKIPGFALK